jgi:hypothetical protein
MSLLMRNRCFVLTCFVLHWFSLVFYWSSIELLYSRSSIELQPSTVCLRLLSKAHMARCAKKRHFLHGRNSSSLICGGRWSGPERTEQRWRWERESASTEWWWPTHCFGQEYGDVKVCSAAGRYKYVRPRRSACVVHSPCVPLHHVMFSRALAVNIPGNKRWKRDWILLGFDHIRYDGALRIANGKSGALEAEKVEAKQRCTMVHYGGFGQRFEWINQWHYQYCWTKKLRMKVYNAYYCTVKQMLLFKAILNLYI